VRSGWGFSISQDYVDPDWVRDEWPALVRHIEQLPFFYSWDNERFPEDSVFAWIERKPGIPHYTNPIFMAWSLQCRGIHDE
jgi:hypothetical protein